MEGRKEEGCEEEERCGGLGGGELKDGCEEEEEGCGVRMVMRRRDVWSMI